MNKLILFAKIILIILFLSCLLNWEYGYYQLVRFIGMIAFVLLAYRDYEKNKIWFYIWVCSAILINPFFKIAFGRAIWNIIDVIWAIVLFISIVILKKK